MANTNKRRLTEEERDRRRAEDRETARRAVEALQSSAGWQQWLQFRSGGDTTPTASLSRVSDVVVGQFMAICRW